MKTGCNNSCNKWSFLGSYCKRLFRVIAGCCGFCCSSMSSSRTLLRNVKYDAASADRRVFNLGEIAYRFVIDGKGRSRSFRVVHQTQNAQVA